MKYRPTYSNGFPKDYSLYHSVPDQPDTNFKMKEIPREDANAELEKKEIVYDPETGSLHKVIGKTHAQGGVPLNLKEGSFVFSNYRGLALTKDEKELYEFKKGGTVKSRNTPAMVLAKEIDLEHHNKMIKFLDDDDKDTISKNSAALMLQKNAEKVGQIAFLQEAKKNETVPDFSAATAPIYAKDMDDMLKQSEQYMKKGGMIKYFEGGPDPVPGLGTNSAQLRKNRRFATNALLQPFLVETNAAGSQFGYDKLNLGSVQEYQGFMASQFPELINDAYTNNPSIDINNKFYQSAGKYGYTGAIGNYRGDALQRKAATDWLNGLKTSDPIKYNQIIQDQFQDGLQGHDYIGIKQENFQTQQELDNYIAGKRKITQNGRDFYWDEVQNKYVNPNTTKYTDAQGRVLQVPLITKDRSPITVAPTAAMAAEAAKVASTTSAETTPEEDYVVARSRYRVGMPGLTKLSIAKNFLDAMSVQRLDPFRQHQESVIPQLDMISAQPNVNAINQSYNNASRFSRSLADTSQLMGNRIDALNQALGTVQNQNIQLANQQKVAAAQSLNADSAANRAYDKKYYDESILSRQNYNDAKEAAFNTADSFMKDAVAKHEAFLAEINAKPQYRGLNSKPIGKDAQGRNIYAGEMVYEPRTTLTGYSTQFNPVNVDLKNISGRPNQIDSPLEFAKAVDVLVKYGFSRPEAIDALKIFTTRGTGKQPAYTTDPNAAQPQQKYGGRYRKK